MIAEIKTKNGSFIVEDVIYDGDVRGCRVYWKFNGNAYELIEATDEEAFDYDDSKPGQVSIFIPDSYCVDSLDHEIPQEFIAETASELFRITPTEEWPFAEIKKNMK